VYGKTDEGKGWVTGDGSVHRFRHTFALNFLRLTKTCSISNIARHSQLEMVRRYTATLGMEDA